MKKINRLAGFLALPMFGTTLIPLSNCAQNRNECTITLDAGEHGQISMTTINVAKNSVWGEIKYQIPNPTCSKGWSFKEWTLNGMSLNDSFVITENITLKCSYNVVFTINFEHTEHGQLHEFTTCEVLDGTVWKDVKKPGYAADQGYIFAGWWNDDHYMYDETVIHSDLTITADFEQGDFYVYYDTTAGGTLSGAGIAIVQSGALFGEIYKPTPVENPGSHFSGWYNGEILMQDSTPITSSITITAKFEAGERNIIKFIAEDEEHCKLSFTKFEFFGTKTWKDILHPELTIDKGYIPTGWYRIDGSKIEDYSSFDTSTTVVAKCTNRFTWDQVYNYTIIEKPGMLEKETRLDSIKPECVNQLDEFEIPDRLGLGVVTQITSGLFNNKSHIKKITSEVYLHTLPSNFVAGCTALESLQIGSDSAQVYMTDNNNPYILPNPEQNAKILKNGSPKLNWISADKFMTESWSNIIQWSNEGGLDLLKQKFRVTTFIGKKKAVRINNQNYLAVVIGENHDELADGSGNKAPLTFQIMHLISDSNGNSLKINFSETKTYNEDMQEQVFANLENSKTPTALDVSWYNSTETRDVYTMLTDASTGTPELLNNIKQVNKKYFGYDDLGTRTIEIKENKSYLFCLNYRELDGGGSEAQGNQYEYWKNNERIIKDINGKAENWRLLDSATSISGRTYRFFYVESTGGKAKTDTGMVINDGIIPLSVCFCI